MITNYFILDKEDIEKINENLIVTFTNSEGECIVICSEKAFIEHKQDWGLVEGRDLVEV